eukprot:c19609_g1_i1 orf=102-761(+)
MKQHVEIPAFEPGVAGRINKPAVVVDRSGTSKERWHRATAKDWKLFMSPRVSDTLKQVTPRRLTNDGDVFQEQFRKIYKEVELLGTSQMSWKEKKALEEKKMVALGAKPEKGHKTPFIMGLNIKRKREKLEQQKLQQDIFAGLYPCKRGKKICDKRTSEDRGIKASEGIFKGGVLYVKPLPAGGDEMGFGGSYQDEAKRKLRNKGNNRRRMQNSRRKKH